MLGSSAGKITGTDHMQSRLTDEPRPPRLYQQETSTNALAPGSWYLKVLTSCLRAVGPHFLQLQTTYGSH
jgi:hypothetical protein